MEVKCMFAVMVILFYSSLNFKSVTLVITNAMRRLRPFVDDDSITKACGCPLLPLKTHIKDKADIVDEAITLFRANVFFKNFHVRGQADKLLIYLTFYINIALKRLEGCRTLAVGRRGVSFPGLFTLPLSQKEAELLRNYLKQIREETSGRLLNCAYRANGFSNKWWLAFAKRKFMNIVILQTI
uniref:Actin-related protein 2/3 complex subunit 3 n=1 Tax=Setaria viridis TaxID=4556 RepID=A0A4U6SX16_SETVI|nr:hypothetical protein SEVIR_9G224900v2 [Setaria viridis]